MKEKDVISTWKKISDEDGVRAAELEGEFAELVDGKQRVILQLLKI